jgi:CheY-like chemotaxis protein
MIAVSDTGHGMDAETKRHIFEPFFTTKPQGKGTGLGLAIVYGTVKQSGGDIGVYSEVNHGTTFKLFLPKVTSETSTEVALEEEASTGGTETILLVEDDEPLRNLTIKMLNQLGYNVLTAPDGNAALQISKNYSGKIDLLLTDVVMPHMSGKQLADAVYAIHPKISIVFISGFTDSAIMRHGVLQPGGALLPKPFTREVLARKLREVLSASSSARPKRAQ